MKSIPLSAIILLLSCLLLACEDSTDSVDLPFQERLVLWGRIEVPPLNTGVQDVYVSRTVPLTENNSPSMRIVTDARVSLQYGDTSAELTFLSGRYWNYNVLVSPGTSYTINIEWNGKRAWASTTTPYPPTISSTTIVRNSTPQGIVYTAEALVAARQGEVYMPAWHPASSAGGGISVISSTTGPLTRSDADANGQIHFVCVFRSSLGPRDSLEFGCNSYDRPYYDYYISRGDPQFSGVPTFSYFEGPVRWNVQGDGVGLFVGVAYSFRRITAH